MMLKICGMRDEANIQAIMQTFAKHSVMTIKPAMMGFIFYEHSPRFVGTMLNPDFMLHLRTLLKTIGVVVNANEHYIAKIVDQYHLCGVQLHGQESPEFCKHLRSLLPQETLLLKAFSIAEKQDFKSIEEYSGAIDYVLFDTKGTHHGGNGTRFDWSLLKHYSAPIPFFLSGGIGLEHEAEIKQIRHEKFIGIDVNSRFERTPAVKDVEALVKFASAFEAT